MNGRNSVACDSNGLDEDNGLELGLLHKAGEGDGPSAGYVDPSTNCCNPKAFLIFWALMTAGMGLGYVGGPVGIGYGAAAAVGVFVIGKKCFERKGPEPQ